MRTFSYLRLLSFVAVFFLHYPASAMEFNIVGSTLVLSGTVVDTDLAKIRDSLDASKVKLIVLHNNIGGDLISVLRIGEIIRDSGIPTTISSPCMSGCGLLFLGGKTRTFSDAKEIDQMAIGLQGAIDREGKQVLTTYSPQIARYISSMTEGKYPDDLMQKTLFAKSPNTSVIIFHPKMFTFIGPPGKKGISECTLSIKDNVKPTDAKPPDIDSKCSIYKDQNAISTGIITSVDLTELDTEVKEFISNK